MGSAFLSGFIHTEVTSQIVISANSLIIYESLWCLLYIMLFPELVYFISRSQNTILNFIAFFSNKSLERKPKGQICSLLCMRYKTAFLFIFATLRVFFRILVKS